MNQPRFASFLLTVLMISTALLWLSGWSKIKYDVSNATELMNSAGDSISCWKVGRGDVVLSYTENSINLSNHSQAISYVNCDQRLPNDAHYTGVNVSGTLKFGHITKINNLSEPSYPPVAYAGFIDQNGGIIKYKTVQRYTGSYVPQRFNKTIEFYPGTTLLRFAIHLGTAGLTVSVTDLSIKVMQEGAWRNPVFFATILAWTVTIALLVSALFHAGFCARTILTMVASLFLLSGLFIPLSIITDVLNSIGPTSFISNSNEQHIYVIMDLAHFIIFASLFVLLAHHLKQHPITPPKVALALLFVALASEGIQLHIDDRTVSISDILLNICGIFTGYLITSVGSLKAIIYRFKMNVTPASNDRKNRH